MSTSALEPRAQSRVDSVYRQLRQAIIDGEYLPGAPLRHQELAEAFGVSLIPVREAMRKLEVERLVDSIPNKGAKVASISLTDVKDVYATRIALESEALRRAWDHLDAESIKRTRALWDKMAEKVRGEDPQFYELHRKVNFSLYERSQSPWLLHLIEILWSHTERYRRLVARLTSFVDEGADLHGVLLAAIEASDLDAAINALRRDLERTSTLILDAYSRHDGE